MCGECAHELDRDQRDSVAWLPAPRPTVYLRQASRHGPVSALNEVAGAWDVVPNGLKFWESTPFDPSKPQLLRTQGCFVATTVTKDNFVRAETNRMLVGLQAQAGGVNRWKHHREPASLDEQTVIRMNRDTLYGLAVVNISDGATVTVPDAGGRYLTVMVVNQDHYINRVFTEPGEYPLTVEEFDTPYVLLGARVLVDATDPADI